MIYLISDTHGDFQKLYEFFKQKREKLCENDYVIVLGDFGAWEELTDPIRELSERAPCQILFLDGNHESFRLLNELPVTEKWGGKVQEVNGVYHLCRGEVFDLPTKGGAIKLGVLGGGTSRDRNERTQNVDWFEEEEITDGDVERLVENVNRRDGIDLLLTHSMSAAAKIELYAEQCYYTNRQADSLTPTKSDYKVRDAISALRNYAFDCYCGHEHMDRNIVVDNRNYRIVYQDVVPVIKNRECCRFTE